MNEDLLNLLDNYKDVIIMATKWRRGDITAEVAMEQITYILTDVAVSNKGE